jgi:hypothetical protein
MKYLPALTAIIAVCFIYVRLQASAASNQSASGNPLVVVELFTSEGCSSCPPADEILQRLDASGAAIVLSEHVDYWNQLGWKDPYSSHLFSERQSAYAKRFQLASSYTPQMIVDGVREFVGSDARQLKNALEQSREATRITVQMSAVQVKSGELTAHVVAGPVPHAGSAVFLALARDQAESQVARGENAGRRLIHAGVVRSLVKIGEAQAVGFTQDARLPIEPTEDPRHLRLIAFVQEPGPGRILGAAMVRLDESPASKKSSSLVSQLSSPYHARSMTRN